MLWGAKKIYIENGEREKRNATNKFNLLEETVSQLTSHFQKNILK